MRKSVAESIDECFSKLVVFYFSSALGRKHFVTYREVKTYLEATGWGNTDTFFPSPKDITREVSELLQSGQGWRTLPTALPTGIKKNDRVPVKFYPSPNDVPSKGGILLLHGLMMSSDFLFKPLIRAFRKEGFDVLLPAAPFHFGRAPRGIQSGELVVEAHFIRAIDTVRQGVTDVRALLRAYRSLTMQPAGIVGISMGGLIGGWVNVLEEVDFSVLVVPAVQFEPTLLHLPLGKIWQQRIEETDLHEHMKEVLEWIKWLEPVSHPLKSHPEDILMVIGMYDRIVKLTESSKEGTLRKWSGFKSRSLPMGHIGIALSLKLADEISQWVANKASENSEGGE